MRKRHKKLFITVGTMLMGIAVPGIVASSGWLYWTLFTLSLGCLLSAFWDDVFADAGPINLGISTIVPVREQAVFRITAKNLEFHGFYSHWHATVRVEINNGPNNLYIRSAELHIACGSEKVVLPDSNAYLRTLSKVQLEPGRFYENTHTFRVPDGLSVDVLDKDSARLVITDQYAFDHQTRVG